MKNDLNNKNLQSASVGVETKPTSETLRQETEAAAWLQDHSQDLEMAPKFMAASRQRLEARIHREARRSRWESQWAQPRFRLTANAVALLLLLFAFVGFNFKLVGAARVSLPGDWLYPLKLREEQVHQALTFGEGRQVALSVALARERSNELQALMIEGDFTFVEVTSMRLLRQVEQANRDLAQAQDLSPVRRALLLDDLNQTLALQRPVLQALVASVPAESRPVVAHVILNGH